jgi:hypothetical protein
VTVPTRPPTAIQRSTDSRDANIWLIPTRDGPVFARFYPDGRRVFFMMPRDGAHSDAVWRPWTRRDRPKVDQVWTNFASWWTDQGYAWPPT